MGGIEKCYVLLFDYLKKDVIIMRHGETVCANGHLRRILKYLLSMNIFD